MQTVVYVNVALEIVTTPTVFRLTTLVGPPVRQVNLGLTHSTVNHVLLLVTIVLQGLRRPPLLLHVRLENGLPSLVLGVYSIVPSVLQGDSQRKLPNRPMTSATNVPRGDFLVRLVEHQMTSAKVDVQPVNGQR